MNFDSMMLAGVAHELQDALLGARVEKISQPSALEIVIHIYNAGQKRLLLISLEPQAARIHFTRHARPNPPSPPAFCMLLRKYLDSGWVEGIEHPFGFSERVVGLSFLGIESRRFTLYVELMGRHSNLILADEDRTILGAVKIVRSDMSRFREIRPGLKYLAPPKIRGVKQDAFAVMPGYEPPAIEFADAAEAEQWLLDSFLGISTFMSHEAVARAVRPLTGESAWFGLNELVSAARLGEYEPVEYRVPGEPLWLAYPVPLRSVPAASQRRASYLSESLDAYYQAFDLADSFRREREALLAALRRSIKSCERELIDTAEGLVNAERADEYKQTGDLILANAHLIKEGAKSAELRDYYDTVGESMRLIDLDPKLSVQDNAARYYKKHQKARDAFDRLSERQQLLEESLEEMVRAREMVTDSQDIHELQQIAQGLGEDVSAHLRPTGASQTILPTEPSDGPKYDGHKIKSYHSVDGWEILVGENATSNDYLTTKIAAPNDIWMHARAITSAHAVIRSQNRPASVSPAALRMAAEQVAKRSDAKHARLVPVDYTLRKFVRKPRRAAPGAVTYSHEKTLDVEPAEG